MQKIRSTKYTSFSLFGVYFIFTTGVIITLTSYLLEPVSALLQQHGHRTYAHYEWTTDAIDIKSPRHPALNNGRESANHSLEAV